MCLSSKYGHAGMKRNFKGLCPSQRISGCRIMRWDRFRWGCGGRCFAGCVSAIKLEEEVGTWNDSVKLCVYLSEKIITNGEPKIWRCPWSTILATALFVQQGAPPQPDIYFSRAFFGVGCTHHRSKSTRLFMRFLERFVWDKILQSISAVLAKYAQTWHGGPHNWRTPWFQPLICEYCFIYIIFTRWGICAIFIRRDHRISLEHLFSHS